MSIKRLFFLRGVRRIFRRRVSIWLFALLPMLIFSSCAVAMESTAPPEISVFPSASAKPLPTPSLCVPSASPAVTPSASASAPVFPPSASPSSSNYVPSTPTPTPTEPPIPWTIPVHCAPEGITYVSASGASLGSYSCGDPVPYSSAVQDGYFDDAVFLGDSRTGNFLMYSGILSIDGADVYYATSATVYNVFTEKHDSYGGHTLMEMLSGKSYGKVYIMLGINEIGYPPSSYYSGCQKLIDAVFDAQPDATVYIEAIFPVTQTRSDSDPVYNNDNIRVFNSILQTVCVEKGAHYVDTFAAYAGINGCLNEDASYDGIHLVRSYCPAWLDYIRTHTVTVSSASTAPASAQAPEPVQPAQTPESTPFAKPTESAVVSPLPAPSVSEIKEH